MDIQYLVSGERFNIQTLRYDVSTTKIEQVEPKSSGLWNLQEEKKGTGVFKATVVFPEMEFTFDELNEKSKTLDHTLYYLPPTCALIFNKSGYLQKAYETQGNRIWQFIKGWPMPYECFLNGFPFGFSLERMWKSNYPVEDVEIGELLWNLDFTWWESDGGEAYSLKPVTVLGDLDNFPKHKSRVEKANLELPVMLGLTQQNRWLILDGVHRFVKAVLDGREFIKAKKINKQELRKFIDDTEERRFKRWCCGLLS